MRIYMIFLWHVKVQVRMSGFWQGTAEYLYGPLEGFKPSPRAQLWLEIPGEK